MRRVHSGTPNSTAVRSAAWPYQPWGVSAIAVGAVEIIAVIGAAPMVAVKVLDAAAVELNRLAGGKPKSWIGSHLASSALQRARCIATHS